MKYLLWFEPERAVVGTPLTLDHPEWFIGEEGVHVGGNLKRPFAKFRLFNFGDPVARQAMTDLMSDLITKEGIDIFRQDCNFAPASFWAQADTRDRQGITQIRDVEGLLEFWDQLRQRHPQLMLDIVERGDLDSISRGVDLTRADYPISPEADPIGNQVATEGLAYWRRIGQPAKQPNSKFRTEPEGLGRTIYGLLALNLMTYFPKPQWVPSQCKTERPSAAHAIAFRVQVSALCRSPAVTE